MPGAALVGDLKMLRMPKRRTATLFIFGEILRKYLLEIN